jgi:nicotinamide mononucleotide transporter
MNIQYWLQLFWQQIKETDFWQWAATVFGIAEVLFARFNNILLYPTGIVSCIISIWILFHVKLYAECLLTVYYIVMSIYGWWVWMKKKGYKETKASYSNKSEWMVTSWITIGGTIVLYFALHHFTNSNVPFLDAFVSATAWAGMWLLARRKIENWVLLNISNIVAIPLLFYKQLPLFALVTVFLFIVAIQGYFSWKKEIASNA